MASKKQIEANRLNGKKGGPKTENGKRSSSRNALKHGALAKSLFENEIELFESVMDHLIDTYGPQTVVKHYFVERIALRMVQSYRLARAEKELWSGTNNPQIIVDRSCDFNPMEETIEDGHEPVSYTHLTLPTILLV